MPFRLKNKVGQLVIVAESGKRKRKTKKDERERFTQQRKENKKEY